MPPSVQPYLRGESKSGAYRLTVKVKGAKQAFPVVVKKGETVNLGTLKF